MDGAIVVNKPAGLTSHDVVARVRRLARERSIGHLGTLDPAATGVLPLLLGRLTRLAQFFQGREKEYRGEIRLGFATDTYDAAGEPTTPVASPLPSFAEIAAILPRFHGTIAQVPPPYSAKKLGGTPAYKLARRGETPQLAPVEVQIRSFEVTALAGDRLDFHVVCGSGAYIRSLAHDLGAALGVGAHLARLIRTRVGEFRLEDAYPLERLEMMSQQPEGLAPALLPARGLLPELPAAVAAPEAEAKLLQGRAANLAEFSGAPLIRIFTPQGQMLAIGRRIAGSLFHPQMVFPPG